MAHLLATDLSTNEDSKVFTSFVRKMKMHRKNLDTVGDSQHANKLSKPMRRLTTIKNERLKELNKAQ
ncbi:MULTISPECIES: hypothetical protein [Enterobacter cloacae complex]|uniref:hypothetical protein n=1 Tax=Enterobacter cloacae complex TaxID=354276 RepID=UPI00077B9B43|nr:hypothetical protein [Enterobacter cloacae]EKT9189931.1 hypothetical protein [Enterobacter cloacae]EKU3857901.1 hypothetical protein [Enterobacter cloacae]EKX9062503.1 hypothetical protein [Enterobacter cloacae]ELR9202828.1 hypothetical protein [Enterobacter cloacae]ELV2834346.1 hypothetical protein [Enterobacter cloacae]